MKEAKMYVVLQIQTLRALVGIACLLIGSFQMDQGSIDNVTCGNF